MKLSKSHLRTLREVPAEAEIPSHILLLRAGMIRKLVSGVYGFMPMGWRSVRKIEQIVREEMDAAGAQEILMSAVQPAELWEERIRTLSPYRVTTELMEKANEGAIFLHCLPSFHDTKTTVGAQIAEQFGIDEMEVTDEVFESDHSVVFDEAENRMHSIKAVMAATLGAKF